MKKENLTKEERDELINFIGEAVLNNSVFPSFRVGVNSITVQEMLNNRNTTSLREFGKAVKKKANDFDPDFSSNETFKVGGFEVERVVKAVKLMIKLIEFNEWKEDNQSKLRKLRNERESLKTPEERKAELDKQIAELEG